MDDAHPGDLRSGSSSAGGPPQRITPRDIFKIIVASIGLYLAYQGTLDLITGVTYTLHLTDYPPGGSEGMNKFFAVRGAIEIAIGVAWIAGFFPFVNLAFPEESKDDPEDGTEEEQVKRP